MYKEFAQVSLGRRIHLLFRLSMTHLRQEIGEIGFGAGDYVFLAHLFVQDGISQDELSQRMRVDKSYTARVLAKLEKEGFVKRRPDPSAYRVKQVFLGPKAHEIETIFFNILENWNTTLSKDIPEDRLEELRDDLDTLIKNAEESLGLSSFQ
ncbi:MAG: winged helix-turn-helix transcriptional regulator [Desulfobacteraceae bacterium]|nr:winged helix-turn-helix transcriptional regulator [Desulfobacteraceae bacterium]